MKVLFPFLVALFLFNSAKGDDFEKYFNSEALRFDYELCGSYQKVTVIPVQTKRETHWGGPTQNLIDKHQLGTYQYSVYDLQSDKLLFRKGFCPIFQEWQTTGEAKKQTRAFYQFLRFPFPKNKVKITIDQRLFSGDFKTIFTTEIDPLNYFITNEKGSDSPFEKIVDSGNSTDKIDLAILAEGYRKEEMAKFSKDAHRLIDSLFSVQPFKELRNRFNVWLVKSASIESGTDIPGERIYRNTRFNSTFYTFDISRYLTTSDMKTIADEAAVVPYDHLFVLVNSDRYGGGGFYNFINVCTSDHPLSPKVFIHEFGHGFGGLGDEYYTSEVAYEDYYNLKVEPWEPNLSTMTNFQTKWKSMIDPSTPVPTPRTKEYSKLVGAFEGGGYLEKGIFSPMQDCRMKSNDIQQFCPVCQQTLREKILEQTK